MDSVPAIEMDLVSGGFDGWDTPGWHKLSFLERRNCRRLRRHINRVVCHDHLAAGFGLTLQLLRIRRSVAVQGRKLNVIFVAAGYASISAISVRNSQNDLGRPTSIFH